MAIIKDVTVKINNGTATLDAPVQFYEKDHDVELRFKLLDYKYKYDKDPQNILNSVDEDILEAYTTIVNPKGYELEQINGVVKNDIVIFRLDPTYTDELDELGTYKLQIHIKCTHSEFTIPPITFEVLQRLKGIKVVTDGEDEVDNSEILDNSSKFVSDETGKLIIEWKKGDMISSAKLNAMVDVINDAVDEEKIRQENEIEREKKANNKIQELENTRVEYVNKIDTELDSFADQVDESMTDYETRFNALTVSQQQDAEVIDARDGEQTLRARLERDIQKPYIIYEEVEGSYINADTTSGYAQNVEILGNTIQNQNDLADIRSVGDKLENQELYEIPVLITNENLFSINDYKKGGKYNITGFLPVSSCYYSEKFINIKPNTTYYYLASDGQYKPVSYTVFYDKNKNSISEINDKSSVTSPSNARYMRVSPWEVVIDIDNPLDYIGEEKEYTRHQEHKLTILSPTPLEKVGDVADRIICKDGVWGVEKNIDTIMFSGAENWRTQNTNTTPDAECEILLNTLHTSDITTNTKAISNLNVTAVYSNNNNVGICYIYNTKTFRIRLNEDGSTGDEVSSYLASNPAFFKYVLAQPTFIPLPYDQQIKLRTFANKTNISFGCEIEPTLKASVPKSIGATVSTHTEQIDNLGKELDRVKKLEESVASTVTTESDFTTVEATSNGYFEDVKLEGKTLVNLCGDCMGKSTDKIDFKDNIVTFNKLDGAHVIAYDPSLLKPNTTYTLIMLGINVQTKIACDLYPDNFPELGYVNADRPICVCKFTTPDDISGLNRIRYYTSNGVTVSSTLYSPIILEGDHTQNPPEFFEGIKSVGQDVDDIIIATTNAPMFFGKGGKK